MVAQNTHVSYFGKYIFYCNLVYPSSPSSPPPCYSDGLRSLRGIVGKLLATSRGQRSRVSRASVIRTISIIPSDLKRVSFLEDDIPPARH